MSVAKRQVIPEGPRGGGGEPADARHEENTKQTIILLHKDFGQGTSKCVE